jgi:hypothetical protein
MIAVPTTVGHPMMELGAVELVKVGRGLVRRN